MHLLDAFANQAALALERALLAREAKRQMLAAEAEKLRNTLLRRSPTICARRSRRSRAPRAASSPSQGRLDAPRRELVHTILEEAERLNRLVGNLLT